MHGNFSRFTFDPAKGYSRVLQHQGQVQLDADLNENAAIQAHLLRTLAADLIGPHGGPADSFKVAVDEDNESFSIAGGHYYVNGILCQNAAVEPVGYLGQPFPPLTREELPKDSYLVYLDVWERHVTHFQDPAIREVALGDAETATRVQVVWQVMVTEMTVRVDATSGFREAVREQVENNLQKWIADRQPVGTLRARARVDADQAADPCLAAPEARFRGVANQLYRVEIHSVTPEESANPEKATFTWSRNNGADVFPVRSLQGETVILEHLGRDAATGVERGDWVELVEDATELRGERRPLRQVAEIHRFKTGVVLERPGQAWPSYDEEQCAERHVFLRRWDHRSGVPASGGLELIGGAAQIAFDGDGDSKWLHLEDGIEVQFQRGTLRPGDYWLIPARTAIADVQWPWEEDAPAALPPHGVEHHYAPLALVQGGDEENVIDLRRVIQPAAK